jgi:hypothetical protein
MERRSARFVRSVVAVGVVEHAERPQRGQCLAALRGETTSMSGGESARSHPTMAAIGHEFGSGATAYLCRLWVSFSADFAARECLTLAKWETVSGQFGGYLIHLAYSRWFDLVPPSTTTASLPKATSLIASGKCRRR